MTSRELADKIDELIQMRIAQSAMDALGEKKASEKLDDDCEVMVRDIADALKRLDHNPGVYVG